MKKSIAESDEVAAWGFFRSPSGFSRPTNFSTITSLSKSLPQSIDAPSLLFPFPLTRLSSSPPPPQTLFRTFPRFLSFLQILAAVRLSMMFSFAVYSFSRNSLLNPPPLRLASSFAIYIHLSTLKPSNIFPIFAAKGCPNLSLQAAKNAACCRVSLFFFFFFFNFKNFKEKNDKK